MPFGVFLAIPFGLFPRKRARSSGAPGPARGAAVLAGPALRAAARIARTLLAGMARSQRSSLYAELRKRWFLPLLPEEHANPSIRRRPRCGT
jgi:hypothetical protein